MTTITIRPLPAWPYEPRPAQPDRFKATYSDTRRLLERELENVGARDVLLGLVLSERDVRQDGELRANVVPQHPGVELSFTTPSKNRLVFHTDAFREYVIRDSWQSNLRAIALGLEALRAVERYGITSGTEQYAGFAQLTAGPSLQDLGRELVERHGSVIAAMRATHPDTGGPDASARDFQAVVAYRDATAVTA